jgi:uncharacterized cupredoxin-like copper-binding protein
MLFSRRLMISLTASTLPALAFGRAARAGTVVKVSLLDIGPTAMDTMDTAKPMGMAVKGADMSMATMSITADPATVPPGEVTFQAVNDSSELVHEMVIARIRDPKQPLPYSMDTMEVDEDGAGLRGKVSELGPGQAAAVTIKVKPGTYMIYCNIAGHYMMGMWTLVTVSK